MAARATAESAQRTELQTPHVSTTCIDPFMHRAQAGGPVYLRETNLVLTSLPFVCKPGVWAPIHYELLNIAGTVMALLEHLSLVPEVDARVLS
jgi:hypothetical protein